MSEPIIDTEYYVPLSRTGRCFPTERGFELELESERLRVTVLADDIVQLKISRDGRWEEKPSHAVCADLDAMRAEFSLEESDATISVTTSAMVLEVSRDPFRIEARRADGSVILRTSLDADGVSWAYARLNDQFVSIRDCRHEDAFLGLGEKTGHVNRKGRSFTMWNTDILCGHSTQEFRDRYPAGHPRTEGSSTDFDPYYISIPFFYHAPQGQAGMAGFYFDNPYRAAFEFAEKKEYRVHFQGGHYTEYVFAGPAMKDILGAYTHLTGRMQAPPLWALGHHQCRWFAYTQETVEQLARKHRDRKIPCDTLWLDIDYMDGYRVFTWNPKTFPDPQGMLARLREQGFRVVTIIDPGVKFEPGYRIYEEGREGDLFCRTPGGSVYLGQVWPGRTAFPDFSLEETRKWWGGLNAEHVKSGLAGIWNDMNEPATGAVPPAAMWFGRGKDPHEKFHNEYAMLMAMGTTEGLLSALPDQRTFVLSRAGAAGIQRYAANWMGDNFSRWDHLWMSVPMALGLGISGQPFVGADIGGFAGPGSMELLIRWYQCATLTPFCRNHNIEGEPDQYPWVFGEAAEKICREAIETRYRLMPYIYTQFMLASESGAPVQRPLMFQYQEDATARQIDDQYLFGSDLLVSPVFEPGAIARNVYLPEGTWYDWRTGEVASGGHWITAAAPLASIPVHVRGGTVLPLWPEAPASTMRHFPEEIELRIFPPGEDGETLSVLHEDDGSTFAFRDGAYLRTTFQVVRQGAALTVKASLSGKRFPEFVRKRFRVRFLGNVSGCQLNGIPIESDEGVVIMENSGEGFELRATLVP